MQSITPCLWFDSQAEEAANFYVSIFKNSKITKVQRYGEEGKEHHRKPVGSVMVAAFEINGQPFTALNGGSLFEISEAVSFQVMCDSQEEVDYYWEKFTADGGNAVQCGWVTDKFGVSWQVVPTKLFELIDGKDAEKSGRAMGAMMQMVKLDIAKLQAAYDGK